MIFTNPQSSSYESRVKERGVLDRYFSARRLANTKLLAALHLSYLAPLAPGRRILDFGCGEGAFVHQALSEGWSAVGIDLNEGLIESANGFWGFDALKAASIDDLANHGLQFDAIYSNQVFEHLRKPVAVGRSLMRLLRPGGVIYIDVPNAAQLAEHLNRGRTLDPTSHFNHFSVRTLRQLVLLMGGECIYSSAAPGLFRAWRGLGLARFAVPLTRVTRLILPGVGAGVAVIGRKPSTSHQTQVHTLPPLH